MTETIKSVENIGKILAGFSSSFEFDRRLFAAAIQVSLAYCDALFDAAVITRVESERVKNGLQAILKRADFNKNYFDDAAVPDVHSFIEARLVQLIGEAGAKISIGRSRREQTVTALRLWLRGEIVEISKNARDLQTALIDSAERQKEAVLPAYAHRQKAQPILWAHWCLAYFEMLERDRERLDEVWRRVNVLPLGAGVLAGTSFEIDREEIARALGFEGVAANSLDAIADADFAIESIGACSLLTIHLSRLAEDLILYNSAEFGFVNFIKLTDAVAANSFPAAGNLDVLDFVRGAASRICGHQTALLALVKSLSLGVHRDLQEIQKAIFDTIDAVKACLEIMRIVVENVRVNQVKTREAAVSGYLNASELADYLIQREVPIKLAQDAVGKMAALAISQNKNLEQLSLEEMRQFSEHINEDIFDALSLEQSLASKHQIGGTAPERVFEALEAARQNLERE